MVLKQIYLNVENLLNADIGVSVRKELSEDVSSFDEDFQVVGPVIGQVNLTNLGEKILAVFNLKTKIKLSCSRCAQKFIKAISLKFEREFETSAKDEDTFTIRPNKTIDILPAIKQEIILSIPIKNLCLPNCKGLRPVRS